MSCHPEGSTESILALELACQNAAISHGKKFVLATANWDGTAMSGKTKPDELSAK